jgi:hypothetical protein
MRNIRERLERLATLTEVKKWADADLFEWTLRDPASLETHVAALAVQEIEGEMRALERGAVVEAAG